MAKTTKKSNKRIKTVKKSTFVAKGKDLNLKEYKVAQEVLKLIKKHNNGVVLMMVQTNEKEMDGIMFSCNAGQPMVKKLVTEAIEYYELIPKNVFDTIEQYGKKPTKAS